MPRTPSVQREPEHEHEMDLPAVAHRVAAPSLRVLDLEARLTALERRERPVPAGSAGYLPLANR